MTKICFILQIILTEFKLLIMHGGLQAFKSGIKYSIFLITAFETLSSLFFVFVCLFVLMPTALMLSESMMMSDHGEVGERQKPNRMIVCPIQDEVNLQLLILKYLALFVMIIRSWKCFCSQSSSSADSFISYL